jgi:hypothetical protein
MGKEGLMLREVALAAAPSVVVWVPTYDLPLDFFLARRSQAQQVRAPLASGGTSAATTISWPPQPPEKQLVGTGAALPHSLMLANTFRRLAAAWKREKLFVSSMTAIEASPHYRDIIALGEPVVPLLLQELQRDPDYWFVALQVITGEDPVPQDERGDLFKMTQRWLAWGRQCGRLS